MARPPYADNARLSHAAAWPATRRMHIPGGHGLNTEVRMSAACLKGGTWHHSCFKLNCACECHHAFTGGVGPK